MKITKFKNLFQVINDLGFVKFQSHSREECEWYRDTHKHSNETLQRVSQHYGQTIKHINVYPNW